MDRERRSRQLEVRLGPLLALCLVAACLTTPTSAQTAGGPPILLEEIDRMDFDRPESWALKYFASVSLITGMGTPGPTRYGSIDVSLEGGWIPSLDEEQRRVGFVGNKVEDLNRNSVFGRLRATFGLPRNFSVILAYSPPIERNGVEAELFNLALARPVFDSESWRVGLRLFGQVGNIEGDFTCPEDIAGVPDPDLNPDLCLEPSNDQVGLDYLGLELSATPKIWGQRWEPHMALSATHMDLAFQVDARYSIFIDRNLLLTDGWAYSLVAGLGYQLSDRFDLVGELFYAPLDVVRDPRSSSENDALVNARILLSYKVR